MQVFVNLAIKSQMDKQKAFEILSKKIDEWENKPKSDGYTYETSFLEIMQELNKDLFQLSVGDLPKDRNGKKKSKPKSEK